MMTELSWIAPPHSPLETLSEKLFRVEGSIARSPLRRQMIIIKEGSELWIL